MTISSELKQTTKLVTIGVVICSIIMELVYFLLTLFIQALEYSYAFSLGNVFMGIVVVLNFFLMGISVQKALDSGDEDTAKKTMQFSQRLRSIGVLICLVLAAVLPFLDLISAAITIAFPQITILVYRLFTRKKEKEEVSTKGPLSDDDFEEEENDL